MGLRVADGWNRGRGGGSLHVRRQLGHVALGHHWRHASLLAPLA